MKKQGTGQRQQIFIGGAGRQPVMIPYAISPEWDGSHYHIDPVIETPTHRFKPHIEIDAGEHRIIWTADAPARIEVEKICGVQVDAAGRGYMDEQLFPQRGGICAVELTRGRCTLEWVEVEELSAAERAMHAATLIAERQFPATVKMSDEAVAQQVSDTVKEVAGPEVRKFVEYGRKEIDEIKAKARLHSTPESELTHIERTAKRYQSEPGTKTEKVRNIAVAIVMAAEAQIKAEENARCVNPGARANDYLSARQFNGLIGKLTAAKQNGTDEEKRKRREKIVSDLAAALSRALRRNMPKEYNAT